MPQCRLAACLILVDLAFIGADGIGRVLRDLHGYDGLLAHGLMNVETDRGVPELFVYTKTVLIIGLLFAMYARLRQPIYLAWSIIFVIVLIDDATRLHEVLGGDLVDAVGLPALFGVPPQIWGETAVWIGLGLLVWLPLRRGFAGSDRPHTDVGRAFLALFAGLLVFAVGVDHLKVMLHDHVRGLGLIEDGGEMIMISLCVVAAVYARVVLARPRPAASDGPTGSLATPGPGGSRSGCA